MERLFAMYKPFCVGILLVACFATAHAQPGAQGEKTPAGQSAAQDNQARRQALRNALQTQCTTGSEPHAGTRGERELSAHERDELRKQLRQQRREAAK